MNAMLESALARVVEECDSRALERDAKAISENYRLRTGTGKRLLTREGEAAAYAAARMPATCAAAEAALGAALMAYGGEIRSLLDVGAGTGAVSWAADALLPLERIICLEREEAMHSVGARLMRDAEGALGGAQWQAFDITSSDPLPQAELVAEGYMLGELEEGMRIPAARKLFAAAGKMALFIEPGTPQGFANLRAVREALTKEGAHVAAPCPQGTAACPMAGEDWCHFAVRVQRTKLHKQLKGGDAPYEDEKYAYLALTKEPPASACGARVLRHPMIAPGRITLTLCEAGEKRVRAVTKKDPLWKRARKIGAGDAV
ncbi:MAG: rRNA methyltransferase [Clostridia bacterium]|nr:rRNA methyltransferase [Clostridia bacterium]